MVKQFKLSALYFTALLSVFSLPAYCSSQTDGTAQIYPSLWTAEDPLLQKQLEAVIKQLGLWRPVKQKHLSVVLVDISNPLKPRLAHVNGNKMFYAASLPKIAILLAAFVEIQNGNLQETDELMDHLVKMIRFSNNKSATHVLNLIGGERVLEILQLPQYSLYSPDHNGGIWVGKPYAKGSAFHRDPLHNLSHGATGIQAARFYYLLETRQLLTPEYSKKMKAVLGNPGIKHKLVKGLADINGIKFYRKSGSWKNFHADSAIIEQGDKKYIVVILSDSAKGGQWITRLAKPLHKLIIQ